MEYEQYRMNPRSEVVNLARTEPLLYKTACLIAAQHNMFRSSSADCDLKYKDFGLIPLLSTTAISIDKRNPLLYLLSIVDTIECTKCFENVYLNDENAREHKHAFGLPIKSILENVKLQLNENVLKIDYSGLKDVICNYRSLCHCKEKREKMFDVLNKLVENVEGLHYWVHCKSELVEQYVVRVEI